MWGTQNETRHIRESNKGMSLDKFTRIITANNGYVAELGQEVRFTVFYRNAAAVVSLQPAPFHLLSPCFPASQPHLSSQGDTEVTSLFFLFRYISTVIKFKKYNFLSFSWSKFMKYFSTLQKCGGIWWGDWFRFNAATYIMREIRHEIQK